MNIHGIVKIFDFNHCIERDGFVFTSVDEPSNIFDAIVIRNPENCNCWCPKKSFSDHTLEEHIEFVNKHKIEKAFITADDISFISRCPSLKRLYIVPSNTAPEQFDYSPLYELPEIVYMDCATAYGGAMEPRHTSIDYSKIKGLRKAYIRGAGHENYEKSELLEELHIGNDNRSSDLSKISLISSLKSLWLCECSLKSLNGISNLNNLQQLSLDYCRSLCDIFELASVAESLRSLSICISPKLKDFSVLSNLVNLEHLELKGNNELPNLNFLIGMKKLKTFSFTMNVLDGDLSNCMNIPYVDCAKNRKHYNYKDKELPKQPSTSPFVLK